jgi:hypothetical protein
MPALTGSQKAYKYALSGVLRSGSGRSNYTSMQVCISIGGVQYGAGRSNANQRVIMGSLTINETNGVDANTCSFQTYGFTPTPGQEVIITLGSQNSADRIFAGRVLNVVAGYQDTPSISFYTINCVDYSWDLTRVLVAAKYTAVSASLIAAALVAMVSGFTTNHVTAGLETIDETSFSFDTVLSALIQLANRIVGFVKVDYSKDVHFGLSDTSGTAPVALTSANLTASGVKVSTDLSKVITRAYVEGGGSNALGDVTAGDTCLPVDDPVWYNDGGGVVVCGPQRITYAGVDAGGGGAVVGPGLAPSAAPHVDAVAGTGITAGAHTYAFTWVTGAGETLPSPLANFTTYTLAGPSGPPSVDQTVTVYGTNQYNAGDTVQRVVTYSTASSPTDFTKESVPSATASVTAVSPPGSLSGLATANGDRVQFFHGNDPSITRVHMWRKVNAGNFLLAYSASNVPGTFVDLVDSSATSADILPAGSGTYQQSALSSIAVGPSGTTSRKVYRTAAGASQLKLLTTIADNTTVTYADSTADGSLGANAPTSDTSGLSQPSGQVLAGATSLLVAGTGAFNTGGGWAVLGNGQQVIRYTGISGNSLTGIPASGTGAIVSTVSYNSSVTAAPSLLGIPASGDGSIAYNIAKGDQVNLLVQVDDITAQVAVAALIGGMDAGVIPDYQRDGRIGSIESTARATATLAQHSALDVSLDGNSRDLNMRAGRLWPVTITHPTSVSSSFLVQSVTISGFETTTPPTAPSRSFRAGAAQFSFTDLIRVVGFLSR